jgi:hypothetical protein
MDEKIKEELKMHKRELVVWAVKCARHVLPYFNEKFPKDKRPGRALETARAWLKGKPKIMLKEIRKASLASHAAARKSKNLSARFAARACGQAVATCHAALHSLGAQYYAIKAVGPENASKERKWQQKQFPRKIKSLMNFS